jgi:hypothetical protein
MAGWLGAISSLLWDSPLLEVGVGSVQNEVNYRRQERVAREVHLFLTVCI